MMFINVIDWIRTTVASICKIKPKQADKVAVGCIAIIGFVLLGAISHTAIAALVFLSCSLLAILTVIGIIIIGRMQLKKIVV